MADRTQVDTYWRRAIDIKTALILLRLKGENQTTIEQNNLDRIDHTNENNLALLNQYRYCAEELGRITFWTCRKTVDMNFKTVCSALERNGFEPSRLHDYVEELL